MPHGLCVSLSCGIVTLHESFKFLDSGSTVMQQVLALITESELGDLQVYNTLSDNIAIKSASKNEKHEKDQKAVCRYVKGLHALIRWSSEPSDMTLYHEVSQSATSRADDQQTLSQQGIHPLLT